MISIHVDKNIGFSGDKLFWMRSKDGKSFWCRQVIAIMGSYNTSNEYRKKHSPFERGFQDNFIEGKGATKEEAFNNMQKEVEQMAESFWAV